MAVTSRHNPLVARFRDAANGDGAVVLLDGAHLVADAMAAGVAADPFGWKALRGSMGSALRLPVAAEVDADTVVEEARRRGCRIVATVPRDGTQLFDIDLSGPVTLLVGGEGAGLPPALAAAAGARVTIPMQAPVESLNATVTAAVILYEAHRQRHHSLFKRVRY